MRQRLSKLLVTGGAGFIGSEFVRQAVGKGYDVVVVDNLTYAGDRKRLAEVKKDILFYKADISDKKKIISIFKKERPEIVVHFAAESHVDRSIQDASPFIKTNITGTQVLLDAARQYKVRRFVHMSTDEVYGEIESGSFTENSPLAPNSPYAASKAAADLLVKSYVRTYGFPALIVRASNNYGPWQYPEKLIPVIILKASKDFPVPVYAKGDNVREWLYVADCAAGIFLILQKGRLGEVYNIGSGHEKKNLVVVKTILRFLRKSEKLIHFVQDRPGHDFRYSLDCSKARTLGFRPRVGFDEGMRKTVLWNQEHFAWLESKLKQISGYWKKVYRYKS